MDKIDWRGGRLEVKALLEHQSCEEHFKMSHCQDTWAQYEEALWERFLSAEEDKRNLKTMAALTYKRDIENYMTDKTFYNIKLGLKGPA
jgi:hypothetical protein